METITDYDWKQDAIERFERDKYRSDTDWVERNGAEILEHLKLYGLVGTPYMDEHGKPVVTVDGVTFRLGDYSSLVIQRICPRCKKPYTGRSINNWVDLGAALTEETSHHYYCKEAETDPLKLLGAALDAFIASRGYKTEE